MFDIRKLQEIDYATPFRNGDLKTAMAGLFYSLRSETGQSKKPDAKAMAFDLKLASQVLLDLIANGDHDEIESFFNGLKIRYPELKPFFVLAEAGLLAKDAGNLICFELHKDLAEFDPDWLR